MIILHHIIRFMNITVSYFEYTCCYVCKKKIIRIKKYDNINYNWNRLWNTMGMS